MVRVNILLLLLVACCSCRKDGMQPGPSGGEHPIRFSVRIPSAAPPRATRAQTASECTVQDVWVLVFGKVGADYVFRYMAQGENIASAAQNTTFVAKLTSSTEDVKLLLAVNSGAAFGVYSPNAGDTEADVRAATVRGFDPSDPSLPMFGEISLASGLDASSPPALSATLLRAVAKIDVMWRPNLSAATYPFELVSLMAYGANDRISIIPAPANTTGSGSSLTATAPTVPYGTVQRPDAPGITIGPKPDSLGSVYLPEAATVGAAERLTGVTRLVVGGKFNGSSNTTYYRLDFDPGLSGHPFGQILRNHHYVFNIRGVLGPGRNTPDEAAGDAMAGVLAEVNVWQDFTSEMYCGPDNTYLGLSKRSMTMRYRIGSTDTLYIQGNVPFAVTMPDGTSELTTTAPTYTSSLCSYALLPTTRSDTYALVSSALADNRGPAANAEPFPLVVHYGGWALMVSVEQENTARYHNRAINVLSLKSDLGYMENSWYGSNNMTFNILTDRANFSPTGTVPISGWNFTTYASNITNQNATQLGQLKTMFASQDVIISPYTCNPSANLSQALLDWVDAKRNRVLVIFLPSNSSNTNLINLLSATDGVWDRAGKSGGNNATAFITPATLTPDNAPFLDGPFGAVTLSAIIQSDNSTYGTCAAPGPAVTPILYRNLNGAMFVGANKERRIVYQGKGGLYNLAINGTTLASDFPRLAANIWTWIADTVVSD